MSDSSDDSKANGAGNATDSLQTPESLIEFPAELSVKAMGLNEPDFVELITTLITPHVPVEANLNITEVKSRHAKYLSIRAHFRADNLEQLHAIYSALRDEPRVLYVL